MAPEVKLLREGSRRNGWSCPPHPLQFVAWLVVIYFILIYFTTLVPVLISEWQPAAYIITGIGCLVHIISHFVAATINPADISVLKKHGSAVTGKFDRRKHHHVIENQYCYLCEVHVGPKSKHCSACNKCIGGFDHHCKWLNNCVGAGNYRWFLSTLVSGLVGTVMVFIVALVIFVGYFTDQEEGIMLNPYKETSLPTNVNETAVFKIMYQPVLDEIWLTIVALTGILGLLALILLVHLFSFHVYLMCKGMSTYDYIVKMRDSENMRNREEAEYPTPKSSFRNKGNRITPSLSRSKGETDVVDGVDNKRKKRQDLREYKKSLENREIMEDNETPPPSSSPIKHSNKNMNRNTDEERTKIKKLKRRKRKSLPELDQQDIATIGNNALYKTPMYHEKPSQKAHVKKLRSLPMPKNHALIEDDSDTAESVEETKHNKSDDRHSHDSGAYMTGGYSNYSSPASHQSPSPNLNNNVKKTKKKKKKQTNYPMSDEESNNELNTTTMFALNESAKINRDGSLDYSNGFNSLPLTPIQKRKRPNEIPPLDLSVLRSSTESHKSFRPYSGGLRDSDTYRYFDRERERNSLLQSVPESGADVDL